ncbi:hypothetical protein OG21DRAFT_1513119 [Imleria badia]|nr:hypothetical protein OG21DRAFT_1513119 [Imleria badia]
MPGPGNKRKTNATSNAKASGSVPEAAATSTRADPFPLQCLTIEEDEITRCGQLATEGYPKPDRCKMHHGQYRTLYKKYKDASKVVDDVKDGAELPTKGQIGRYTDWHAALEKARWVRKYLEAIRVEKAGREIHQKRFFLKVDDGHRRRVKLLEREMVRAVDALDALQRRAYEPYQPETASHAINDRAPSTAEVEFEKQSRRTTAEFLESIYNPDTFNESSRPIPSLTMLAPEVGNEDLIDMSLRDRKEKMIMLLKPLIDFESFVDIFIEEDSPRPETEHGKSMLKKQFFVYQLFARRIIFHQPTLFMKALEKVSSRTLFSAMTSL